MATITYVSISLTILFEQLIISNNGDVLSQKCYLIQIFILINYSN
jgi:hypothetical protein